MKTIFRITLLAVALSQMSRAQAKWDVAAIDSLPLVPVHAGVDVTIQTTIEGARVYLDSDSLGITPLTIPSVKTGMHHIKLVPPDVENWLSEPILDSLLVQSSESGSQTFRYSFNQQFLILSSPSNAEVFSQDSLLGTTPLVIKTTLSSLKLKKEGFEDTKIEISNAKRGILSAQLKKLWQNGAEESTLKDENESGSSLRLYITGATTILAGAASAYFKVRADNSYGQYVSTGDPDKLSEVDRLDAAAGVALAATQISIGLFIYFILSE